MCRTTAIPATLLLLGLQPPFWGIGSENNGQNIDESLESRTRSYLVTRFQFVGPELRVGESLESQTRRSTERGTARPAARGSSR